VFLVAYNWPDPENENTGKIVNKDKPDKVLHLNIKSANIIVDMGAAISSISKENHILNILYKYG